MRLSERLNWDKISGFFFVTSKVSWFSDFGLSIISWVFDDSLKRDYRESHEFASFYKIPIPIFRWPKKLKPSLSKLRLLSSCPSSSTPFIPTKKFSSESWSPTPPTLSTKSDMSPSLVSLAWFSYGFYSSYYHYQTNCIVRISPLNKRCSFNYVSVTIFMMTLSKPKLISVDL